MATKEDSGLVDRRSIRDLEETSVGGSRAPRNAKAQLANTRELRRRLEKEKKRIAAVKRKRQRKKLELDRIGTNDAGESIVMKKK